MGVSLSGFIANVACSSIVKTYQDRVDRIYDTHEEISEITKELQDIEQVMLYVGRIKDSPIADYALDVAIAIHGEPDDSEKLYAENITPELIQKDRERAISLVSKQRYLHTVLDKEKTNIVDDFTALNKLEAKYEFASQLISRCIIGIGLALLAFFVMKFLL